MRQERFSRFATVRFLMALVSNFLTSSNRAVPQAVLRQHADRGPVRNIVTGRRHQPTGLFPSRKLDRTVPYESSGERLGILFAEVDEGVTAYYAQPFRLEWRSGGVRHSYVPDRLDLYAQKRVVVEIKYAKGQKLKPEYAQKIDEARSILKAAGFEFKFETAEELKASPSFAAVEEIIYHAHTPISDDEIVRVVEHLAQGPASVSEVEAILGGGLAGRAKLCAMVPPRYLKINLDGPIGVGTRVALSDQGRAYV